MVREFCDRCDGETAHADLARVTVPGCGAIGYTASPLVIDICPRCLMSLHEWHRRGLVREAPAPAAARVGAGN